MTETSLPYRYRGRGRTVLNTALFAIGIGLLALAIWSDARPQIIYVPLFAFVGMMAWLLLRNPQSGLEIDTEAVRFWRSRRLETVPVAEIDHVHMEHWSDSVDVTVHLTSGGKIDIPV